MPLIIQGPLIADLKRSLRAARPDSRKQRAHRSQSADSMHRFALWKQAQVRVLGRPDWLFIKLHCHSMDPTQKDAVIGDSFRKFLAALVGGAAERNETLHFVTAREMTNILLAACDGREGDPGDYRDYRFKRIADMRCRRRRQALFGKQFDRAAALAQVRAQVRNFSPER